jgi:hypothetical protein
MFAIDQKDARITQLERRVEQLEHAATSALKDLAEALTAVQGNESRAKVIRLLEDALRALHNR